MKMVYMTVADDAEAEKISRDLLEKKLVACTNIFPKIRSLYWWEGRIADDREVVVVAKTREENIDQVISRVREIHSYDCPCIVSWDIGEGNPDFLEWISSRTIIQGE